MFDTRGWKLELQVSFGLGVWAPGFRSRGVRAHWTTTCGRNRQILGLVVLVWGLGFGSRVWGSRFMVQGSGFGVQGSGFRVQGSGFRVFGFRCSGVGSGVQTGPRSRIGPVEVLGRGALPRTTPLLADNSSGNNVEGYLEHPPP